VFILGLWQYLRGHLLISVIGGNLEEFVNLALMRGIFLWDLRRTGDGLVCKIGVGDFPRIRPVVRRSWCKVRILERIGLPFVLHRVRKYRIFYLGALLCALGVYALSSVVWMIRVVGCEHLEESVILDAARKAGVYVGAPKFRVNTEDVQQELVLEIPGLSWAGVKIRGTVVIIEVVEKTQRPKEADPFEPADVISARNGVITEIMVLKGRALVKKGDTVKAGQVLITGSLEPAADGVVQLTRARGEVKARCWYEGYAEAYYNIDTYVRTGNKVRSVGVRFGNNNVIWQSLTDIPYQYYQEEVRTYKAPIWRNIKVPVEVIIVNYYETNRYNILLTPEQAKNQARDMALKKALTCAPPGVERASIWSEVVEQGTHHVGVRVVVETIEEVGVTVPIALPVPGESH